MRFLFIALLQLIISLSATAEWFETQGQAYINNNDQKEARIKAIENALKKTLLVAGASVSSVQQVVNGLLTKDELNIKAAGVVNSFEILSENYTDDIVEVTIRTDIFPKEKQCYSADYRKTLLLTQSHITQREQANIGKIYNIDREVISQLGKHISSQSKYITAKIHNKKSLAFSRFSNNYQDNQIKKLSTALANNTSSQFILYSEITDLSIENKESSAWNIFNSPEADRHFNLSMYIYDGINGEVIFNKHYASTTPWPFTIRESIDPASQRFWQSKYGQKVDLLLKDISLDIEESLMCQPTQGKIIAMEDTQLFINLGNRHGVKVGDEFSLLGNTQFTAQNGKNYNGFNVSPYKVKVIKTNRDSSTLVAVNGEQLGNIQIYDIVVRY